MDVDKLARDLTSDGFAVVESSLGLPLLASLATACHDTAALPFAPSGMGRGVGRNKDLDVRNDTVRWLDHAQPAAHQYLDVMDDLRRDLNERLYLGLVDYECHYAIYGAGAPTGSTSSTRSRGGRTGCCRPSSTSTTKCGVAADGGELVLYSWATSPARLRRRVPQAVARG